MSKGLGYIDGGLEHQNAERDARDPGPEAECSEAGEEEEDDAAAPVLTTEHVYCRRKHTEFQLAQFSREGLLRDSLHDDIEDTCNPDELFREEPCEIHISIAED